MWFGAGGWARLNAAPFEESGLGLGLVTKRLSVSGTVAGTGLFAGAGQARAVTSSEPHTLYTALRSGAADWADARVPELLAWLRAGQRRSELQDLLRSGVGALPTLTAAHARALLELLLDWGIVDAGRVVSALPQLRADADVAALRARLAMHARDYRAAIEASELAIRALLQPGLSIEEFLRLCVAGAPAEGMLRFERQVIGSRVHLSERLALRWEALHRAGMSRDASLMQLMCQRYFPERASVWATAGNHALDADELNTAEAYFQRCLQLDPSWTAGLAGLAIVCERRKDWAAALPYRRRVVEVEQALERDDAASLQRRLRYAAALARLGRWRDAEPLFRGAVRSKALAQLPAEHPVLVRVFSQELYAPALVAALSGRAERTGTAGSANDAAPAAPASGEEPASSAQVGSEDAASGAAQGARVGSEDAAIVLARHEAVLLEQLALALRERAGDLGEQRWSLALCAFLAGELERAFELLDQVEVDRPEDLALHYLLWRCASASAHAQTASIRAFAEQAARAAWTRGAALSEQERGYAVAILPELSGPAAPQQHSAAEMNAQPEGPALAELERIVAFRALREAQGDSPLMAAAASSLVLAALVASVTSK